MSSVWAIFSHLKEAAGGRAGLLITATAVLLAAWLALTTLGQYLRLRHIPGPRIAGISKAWMALSARGGRMHLDLYEAIETYGPGVPFTRIGPQDVTTKDPAFMRHMLSVHSPYQKSDWYNAMRFNPERDNILSIRDNELHTRYRAKLAPGVCTPCEQPYMWGCGGLMDIVHGPGYRATRAAHRPQHP